MNSDLSTLPANTPVRTVTSCAVFLALLAPVAMVAGAWLPWGAVGAVVLSPLLSWRLRTTVDSPESTVAARLCTAALSGLMAQTLVGYIQAPVPSITAVVIMLLVPFLGRWRPGVPAAVAAVIVVCAALAWIFVVGAGLGASAQDPGPAHGIGSGIAVLMLLSGAVSAAPLMGTSAARQGAKGSRRWWSAPAVLALVAVIAYVANRQVGGNRFALALEPLLTLLTAADADRLGIFVGFSAICVLVLGLWANSRQLFGTAVVPSVSVGCLVLSVVLAFLPAVVGAAVLVVVTIIALALRVAPTAGSASSSERGVAA